VKNEWALFLKDLSDTLPDSNRFKHFLIGFPCQGYNVTPAFYSVDVAFADSVDDPDSRLAEKVTYRARYGSNIKDWLRSLAERTRPQVVTAIDSDGDSDDDQDVSLHSDEDDDDDADGFNEHDTSDEDE
jgi:hypothetical protein